MSDTISLGFKLTGESDFKRALADINNSLKVNASEMALVSARYDDNGKSTESLSAKNKVLQSTIETENQKISTLKQAIDNASSAHAAAGANIERLKSELAAASAKMAEMKSSTDTTKGELLAQQTVIKDLTKDLSTAEKAYASTGKNTANWSAELNNAEAKVITMNKKLDENQTALSGAEEKTSSLGGKVRDLANAVGLDIPPALDGMITKLDGVNASAAALAGVLVGITTALYKATTGTMKSADEIDRLSKTSGMTTDQIQELNYASELLDVDTSTVTGSLTKMIRSMESSKNKTSDQANTRHRIRFFTLNKIHSSTAPFFTVIIVYIVYTITTIGRYDNLIYDYLCNIILYTITDLWYDYKNKR